MTVQNTILRKRLPSSLTVAGLVIVLHYCLVDGETKSDFHMELGSPKNVDLKTDLRIFGIPSSSLVTIEVSENLADWQKHANLLGSLGIERTLPVQLIKNSQTFRAAAVSPQAKLPKGRFDILSARLYDTQGGDPIVHPYHVSSSLNKKWTIFSKASRFHMPDLYVRNNQSQATQRLTQNQWIEYSPVINNSGDYAYSLFKYSSGDSEIHLNGEILKDPKMDDSVPFFPLAISDSYLCFASDRDWDDRQFIYTFDLANKTLSKLPLNHLFVQQLRFISTQNLLVEVFNLEAPSSDVHLLNCSTQVLAPVAANPEETELIWSADANGFEVVSSSGDINGLLLHNFLITWVRTQFASPFANGNNELGRLSWNQSYLLEATVEIARKTNHPSFIAAANRIATDILAVRNKFNPAFTNSRPEELWTTTKYSIDRSTPLNLLVDDAKIIYPLLRGINTGILDPQLAPEVISVGEFAFEEFERDYIPSLRLYRAQPGIKYRNDGIWLPNNMQNAFALCLVELFKATGKPQYSKRAMDLAQRFRHEWIRIDSGFNWHYWPLLYYRGWTKQDQLSVHCPTREAYTDELFEDVSHAGISIKFIHEFRNAFGENVFTDLDYETVQNQLTSIIRGDTFTRFISGNIQYSPPSFRYIPQYGWGTLQNPILRKIYSRYIPLFFPDFDNAEVLTTYAEALPDVIPQLSINIETKEYDVHGNPTGKSTLNIDSLDSLLARFGISRD